MSTWLLAKTARHEAAAEPSGIAHVRHEARKTLDDWGVGDVCDAAVLAASEMLTNALLYGRAKILALELTLDECWLSLSVPDANPTPPYPCGIDEQAEGGRGVYLTAELADAWGFRATSGGKSVFAEFLTHHSASDDATASLPVAHALDQAGGRP